MSLSTRSSFFSGYTITAANNKLDFSEGGGELQATIAVGSFSMTTLLTAISNAMNTAGALTYTVTVSRATRKYTIASTSTFSLLALTGSRLGQSPWSLLGYSATDKTGSSSYESENASGVEFRPQFFLQSFIESAHNQDSVKTVVNESASGALEIVTFADTKFFEMNIRFNTNVAQGSGNPIESNLTGLTELVTFMEFATTKGLVEFMPDRATPNDFFTIRLESTPTDKKGTAFRLRELFDRGLAEYFDTGILKWRDLT